MGASARQSGTGAVLPVLRPPPSDGPRLVGAALIVHGSALCVASCVRAK